MQKKLTRLVRVALITLVSLAVGSPAWSRQSDESVKPRLLLFVTVDQLRYDYLERLRDEFSGGFSRLLREGVAFDRAFQAHAVTSTGPGHASLATGTYPSHSGIVNNQWFDRTLGETVNCVEDPRVETLDSSLLGRSPRNLLVETLADWIKAADPRAKVYGASRKDRSAILPAGHHADGAFWYDSSSGRFVTSSFYMERYPSWVGQFYEEFGPASFFGRAWKRLEVSAELVRRTHFEGLDLGAFRDGFPRALGRLTLQPDARFFSDFGNTPFMDHYLAEFVKRLVAEEGLGTDESLDFLAVSFSALDSVGHQFGPNSPEVLDTLLRLDATLGELLSFLDQRVGKGRYVVTLSADHGVVPLPEYQSENHLPGARVATADVVCVQRAGGVLGQRYGEAPWFVSDLYLNYELLGRWNLLRSDVESTIARSLESCPSVRKAWTRTQLTSTRAPSDQFQRLYQNSFHPLRSPDLLVQWQEYWLSYSGRGTSHGSPYDYDRHVPLVIAFPGVAPRRVELEEVETVDLAPTLCSLLGLSPGSPLDGHDRSSLFSHPHHPSGPVAPGY